RFQPDRDLGPILLEHAHPARAAPELMSRVVGDRLKGKHERAAGLGGGKSGVGHCAHRPQQNGRACGRPPPTRIHVEPLYILAAAGRQSGGVRAQATSEAPITVVEMAPSYLVFDIETVPDTDLYLAPDSTAGEARPFPPLYVHKPIVIGCL